MFSGKTIIFSITTWKDPQYDYTKYDLYVDGKFRARYETLPMLLNAVSCLVLTDGKEVYQNDNTPS